MKVRPIVVTPKEYCDALHDNYDPGDGDFTVTQLLRPPRQTGLIKLHGKTLEEPERSWPMFLGSCMHDRMEATAEFVDGGFVEQRLYAEVGGYRVSGQLDRYDYEKGGIVSDYKLMANQQFSAKPEHVMQAQMNGLLAHENNFPVKFVRLFYADKSWSITRALRQSDYPGSPWSVFIFDFDYDLANEIMTDKVKDHADALKGNPRDCTDEEMWKANDQWAVRGTSAKRARKLCDTREEAEEIKKASEVIEHRPAERTYCEFFCGFKDTCKQYKRQS